MSDEYINEEQPSFYDNLVSGTQYYVSRATLPVIGSITGYLTAQQLGANEFGKQIGAFSGIATGIYAGSNIGTSDIIRGATVGATTYGITKLAQNKINNLPLMEGVKDNNLPIILGGVATIAETKGGIVGNIVDGSLNTVKNVTDTGINLVENVKNDINNKAMMIIYGGITTFLLLYAYNQSKKND